MHDFEETTPVPQPMSALRFGFIVGIGGSLPFGLLFAAAVPFNIAGRLLVFLISTLLIGAFAVPYGMLLYRWTSSLHVQRIVVMKYIDGVLRVERGLPTYEAPLKDCVWQSQITEIERLKSRDSAPPRKARILIEMPPSAAKQSNPLLLGMGSPHVVKVGFSPEMEERWLKVLSESKVVENLKPNTNSSDGRRIDEGVSCVRLPQRPSDSE
jgi:hypothetical protein